MGNEDIKNIYLNNGSLYAFGRNNYGQSGLGDYKDRNIPTLLMQNKNIKNVYCRDYNTFIHENSFGQLGLSDRKSRNKPVLPMRNIESIYYEDHCVFVYQNNGYNVGVA
jgi:alpha-tubulin suppressor-like RCC1 family protein